jgi:hypothetical protein
MVLYRVSQDEHSLSEPGNEVSVILTAIEKEIVAAPGVFQLFPVAMDPSEKHARITFNLAEVCTEEYRGAERVVITGR